MNIPRALARRGRNFYRQLRDSAGLRALDRTYRQRYGAKFVTPIHPQDEMMMFLRDVLPLPAPGVKEEYFRSGESMLRDLQRIAAEQGQPLRSDTSFLEFACGYGRFTRFLVTVIDPAQVTVSDIDRAAVEELMRTYGVKGFVSAADPEAVTWNSQHDLIFVASLFSHLALDVWARWAERLMKMLKPGGLLIFSTHGQHALDKVPERDRQTLTTPEGGFFYGQGNETKGRLEGSYYGTAYVTESFVRRTFETRQIGHVTSFIPQGLWEFQDVYVCRA